MGARKSISELETHVGYWLRFVSNHVSQAFAQKVETQGVTVAEWVLLREMLAVGETNPSQLASGLGMTRGAISKLIDRLSLKQLAERRSVAGDQRYQSVTLTPAGKKLVPVLARLADENDREFFGHLDQEEHALWITQLQDIVRRNGWKDVPVQ